MKLYVGVDVGSSSTKAVLINSDAKILGYEVYSTGADFNKASEKVLSNLYANTNSNSKQINMIVSTGYGRNSVEQASAVRTELDCHGRGAYYYFKNAITVIDVGGQDSKIVKIDANGKRIGHIMNRKCAAGTGSFLEEIALRLNVSIDLLPDLVKNSKDHSVKLGSFCTVFAKTEILSKIREGVKQEDLARAALESVARRVLEMQTVDGDVVITGGVVAHFPEFVNMIEKLLSVIVKIPKYPQHTGALGAALWGLK